MRKLHRIIIDLRKRERHTFQIHEVDLDKFDEKLADDLKPASCFPSIKVMISQA
jgi:hypothetical protein